MLFAPLFGYFGDRHSRKLIMTIGVLIWVVATLVGSFMPVSTLDGGISWLFVWQLRLVAYTSNIKDGDVLYHLSGLRNDFNPFKSAIQDILKTKAEVKSKMDFFRITIRFLPCEPWSALGRPATPRSRQPSSAICLSKKQDRKCWQSFISPSQLEGNLEKIILFVFN